MPCDPLGRAVCVTEGRGRQHGGFPRSQGSPALSLAPWSKAPRRKKDPLLPPPSAHSLGGVGGAPSGALRMPVFTQEAVGSGAWPPLTHMVPASARGGGSWQ